MQGDIGAILQGDQLVDFFDYIAKFQMHRAIFAGVDAA